MAGANFRQQHVKSGCFPTLFPALLYFLILTFLVDMKQYLSVDLNQSPVSQVR